MRKTRYHGRRSRKHTNSMSIFGIIGGLVGIGAIIFIMCLIVIGDNKSACEKINLNGTIIGCSVDKKYAYDGIAIVSGNTKNSPVPMLSNLAKKYIVNSLAKNGEDMNIKIFSASSAHEKISNSIKKDGVNSDTIEDMTKAINLSIDDITESIQSKPISNGAEYLETIIKASKSLRSDSDDGDKLLIIVIGSGLSDGGLLDFTSGDPLKNNVGDLYAKIKESKELREGQLDGVTLLWSGLGEVSSPQNSLSELERQVLEQLYVMVLEDLGANVLDYDEIDPSSESIETTFTVKTVNTSARECLWCEAKEFTSDDLKFGPDSIAITDQQTALSKLMPLVNEMKANEKEKVTITGYAARAGHCGAYGGSSIPLGRANTVKQLLIAYGVESERIITKDGGHGKYDECVNGYFSEEIAKKNRIIEFKAFIEG